MQLKDDERKEFLESRIKIEMERASVRQEICDEHRRKLKQFDRDTRSLLAAERSLFRKALKRC